MHDKMFSQTGWYTRFEKWMMAACLNLLFLISCLPLVTLGPALATLTKLAGQVGDIGSFSNLFLAYIQEFSYFLTKRYLLSNLPFVAFGVILLGGFYLAFQVSSGFLMVIILALLCSTILYFAAAIPRYLWKMVQGQKMELRQLVAEVAGDVHVSIRLAAMNVGLSLLASLSFMVWPVLSTLWVIIGFYLWASANQKILKGGSHAVFVN